MTLVNVALAPDDNYAYFASVVIKSAVANSSNPENITFWILDGGLSDKSKSILKSSAKNVEFLVIDKEVFADFKGKGYISISAWYRFALSKLLPTNISKILYLDCDIAVNCDLQEMFEIDLNNYAIGAVKDCIWKKFNKRIDLDSNYHYFNSGVLLINVDYWRENKIEEKLFGFLKESPERINMLDQSVLNIVLGKEYKEFPLQWNVQYVPAYIEECCYEKQEFQSAMANPKIIHFVNRFKPWDVQLGWLNPLSILFTKYMDNPPKYTDKKCRVFFKLFAKRFIRKPVFIFRKFYWNNIFIKRR